MNNQRNMEFIKIELKILKLLILGTIVKFCIFILKLITTFMNWMSGKY